MGREGKVEDWEGNERNKIGEGRKGRGLGTEGKEEDWEGKERKRIGAVRK